MHVDVDIMLRVLTLLFAVGSPILSWFLANGKATAAAVADVRKYAEDLSAKGCARIDGIEKRLSANDLRISKIEQDMKHIPDKDAVHRIELTIQRMQGDVEQATSQWRGVQASIQRLEEYLVHAHAPQQVQVIPQVQVVPSSRRRK